MSIYHQVMSDSPVAYWPLDEASGTQAKDVSGNGHHGTYTGGFTLGSAGPGGGKAVDLDGSTGYVDVGDDNAFTSTNLTAEGWVNRDNLTAASAMLITKVGASFGEWAIDTYAQAIVYNNSGGVYCVTDGAAMTVGTWAHLAMTFDGTTLRLYRNGTQESTSTSLAGARQGNTGDSVMLGRRQFTGSPLYVDGRIAHCAYYSTVLSADRIKAHYRAGLRERVSY